MVAEIVIVVLKFQLSNQLICIIFCFRFWRGGQPDNGAGDPGNQVENCVEMDPQSEGKWNDENCIAPQYYVCARDISKYGWSVIF